MARIEAKIRGINKMFKRKIDAVREVLVQDMRSYEERILAWTSIYIAVMAMIVTYLYTAASPPLDLTHTHSCYSWLSTHRYSRPSS